MAGRPRKPRQFKVIHGTTRPDRKDPDPVELDLVDKVPDPPDWLPNAHATREFKRLAKVLHGAGLLTEAGIGPLEVLCALHGKLIQKFSAGDLPTGHAVAQYRALCNDFGLTPVAQGKVRPSGEEKKGNKFEGNGRRPAK